MEHKELEEHGHDEGEIEPAIVRRLAPNELLAEEMKKHRVDCSPIPTGSHEIERKEYYSQVFALSSRLVTNKGLIRLRGRKIDFVQILQRI